MTAETPVVEKPKRDASVGSPTQARVRNQRALAVLSLLVLFAGLIWLSMASLSAVPDVVPAAASPLVFSAERAMADLRVIAAAPRPVGSAANGAIGDYLMTQIAALGPVSYTHLDVYKRQLIPQAAAAGNRHMKEFSARL